MISIALNFASILLTKNNKRYHIPRTNKSFAKLSARANYNDDETATAIVVS